MLPHYLLDAVTIVSWKRTKMEREQKVELLNNEIILKIAQDHEITSAQAILRWNLQKGVVVIRNQVIPNILRKI